jgi:c(7)-type cytochrome triheme protein
MTSLRSRLARPGGKVTGLALAVVMLAAAVLLGACSSWRPGGIALFQPAPPPKPVVHAPRHVLYKPPPPPVIFVEYETTRTDWPAALAKLPQHASGGTDWVGAINAALINPKPGLDEKAEAEPELDLNIELVPKDMPDFKVTYPHKIHTQLLACTTCHTGIFQMQAGADPITMEQIFAGEYCGRCHGKVAFDPTTACPRCHLGMAQ